MAQLENQEKRTWPQRLLFVDSLAPTPLPRPRAHEEFVITALLRRGAGISASAFRGSIERDLAARLRDARAELGLASLKVFRDVSARGILSFFLQLTRSRAYTAFLCRVLGRASPPRYRLRYGVLYDSVLQLTFDGNPEPSRIDAALALLRDPGLRASECIVLGSERQYTVYDGQSARDERKRIDICFLVNRPDGTTRDACQAYWRTRHADLALRNMRYLGLTRYLQVHTMETPQIGLDDSYDGVVYAEKSSRARLLLELAKPDSFRFNNTIVIDETNFTECTPIMLLRLAAAW